jgi:hypothetical protein
MLAPSEGARVQVELQDILALVVGYGMAAVLFRAFWPVHPPWPALWFPGAVLYIWLGLAMSGPIVLLRLRLSRRPPPPTDWTSESVVDSPYRRLFQRAGPPRPPDLSARDARTTWAERAWLLIGAYWIVLGIFVIPARLHDFKLADVLRFGLAPLVVAIGLRVLGPPAPRGTVMVRGWTHNAAIALLLTWPLAWICLIFLGKSMQIH